MKAKKLLSLVLAAALLLCASLALASGIGGAAYTGPGVEPTSAPMTMYVVTDNGRGLNVRSSPYLGNNVIGLALYGEKVDVLRFQDDGWACILWNGYEAYVQSRFLQWYAPSPVVTPAPTAAPVYPTVAPAYTDTLAVLNAEYRTARLVTPFAVTVTPTHTNGWVNMRWAPSKDVEVLATYRSGAKLTVIAETQSWYQVADPDTDATGFIMKTYVKRSN